MKIISKLFLTFILLLSVTFSFAQMGMGGMQGGGMNGGGMGMNGGGMGMGGGGMGRGMGNGSMQIPQGEQKVEKIDVVQVTVDRLEKDLTLDAFQKAVIKQAFQDGELTLKSILDSKISDEMKELKMTEIRNNTDKRIAKVLSKEQLDKYEKLKIKAQKRR
ncbi:MAG: hypothetical protein RLZZ312_1472 [Bacteroidota bacterium]|jgi:hypothetical protein